MNTDTVCKLKGILYGIDYVYVCFQISVILFFWEVVLNVTQDHLKFSNEIIESSNTVLIH